MFVKDILPDLPQAIGHCTDAVAYRRLTDAVRLLTNKQLIDSQLGEIAVCVCGNFATLPPEVQTVLGVTVDGCPAIIRDQWFTYHINGPGDTGYTPFKFTDVLGNNFPTIREPDEAVKIGARIRAASDQNKILRIFGWDESGDRIFTTGADGTKEDGFLVPMVYGSVLVNSEAPAIAKIDRVYKEETADMVDMFAIDPATLEATSLLGRYRPREETPAYTRIRVPEQQVVRVKYRRRVFEVEDQYDWLPVDNREALIHALRAVKYRMDGKYTNARDAEAEAVRLVNEDTNANRPGGIKPPQIINNEMPRETAGSSMFYGGANRGWTGFGY
jgi:hypothetical protein